MPTRFPRLAKRDGEEPWQGLTRQQVADMIAAQRIGEHADVDLTGIEDAWTLRWSQDSESWGVGPAGTGGGSLALGETSSTAYRGDRGKTAYDHSQVTSGNPHGTTAADVGALPGDTVIPDITGLQATSEKNQPNGYAGLDGDGTIPDNRIPSSIARDTEIGTQITAHDGSGTAHPDIRELAGRVAFVVALSDETTALTTGQKSVFRAPHAFTLTGVRASLTTASSSGLPTVDIREGGTTVLSTKVTVDVGELTSTTAATAAVISDASIADDAALSFHLDVAGTGAAGLKVTLIGVRT